MHETRFVYHVHLNYLKIQRASRIQTQYQLCLVSYRSEIKGQYLGAIMG